MSQLGKYFEKLREAKEKHSLTYSGWLQFVKNMTEKQVSKVFNNAKLDDRLQREYDKWIKDGKMKYIKNRVQLYNPIDKYWIKINQKTGKVLGKKNTPYKGIRKFSKRDLYK